ncbi:hypothetical protein Pmani_020935 [Petrolisthes manimaculis]|uniref:OTU domain-containing protein n=1 Tax=Petrolisthes manimaculis TaxID=1843537 RepID=A0AAE1PF65_9EUCA|nr:hypothetical protein Pmani_020935 [Petrolisthes manimaculis]
MEEQLWILKGGKESKKVYIPFSSSTSVEADEVIDKEENICSSSPSSSCIMSSVNKSVSKSKRNQKRRMRRNKKIANEKNKENKTKSNKGNKSQQHMNNSENTTQTTHTGNIKKTAAPQDTNKPLKNVNQVTKTETEKQITKTETEKQITKTKTKKQITKTETEKQITKTKTKKQITKTETEKQITKTKTVKQITKTETEKQTTKTETEKQITKTKTKKQITKTKTEKQTTKTETEKQITKTETEKQITKTENATQPTKSQDERQCPNLEYLLMDLEKHNLTQAQLFNIMNWHVLPTAADGHCLLYSVVSGWNNQHMSRQASEYCTSLGNSIHVLTYDLLWDIVRQETRENSSSYKPFFTESYSRQVHKYLIEKNYRNEFGDLVPSVICNALNIKLLILKKDSTRYSFSYVVVAPFEARPQDDLPTLVLLKSGEHYNGVSFTY